MYKILTCKCHKISRRGLVLKKKDGRWFKLKNVIGTSGYYQVSIHRKTKNIHRMLGTYFLKNEMNYPWVRHLNDVKTDNRLSNLKWGSKKMNGEDKVRNGHSLYGERHPSHKLNDLNVKFIKTNINKYSLNYLANKFNVSKKLILLIKQNKKWKHIKI